MHKIKLEKLMIKLNNTLVHLNYPFLNIKYIYKRYKTHIKKSMVILFVVGVFILSVPQHQTVKIKMAPAREL